MPVHLAHALFHHGAALGGVGVLVADQHAVFIVLVAGDDVGVAGHAGNGARGDAALGDLVALVRLRGRRSPFEVISSPRSMCGWKSSSFGIDAEPAFGEQQIAEHDAGTLEAVGDVEDLRDQREAIGDVERRGDDAAGSRRRPRPASARDRPARSWWERRWTGRRAGSR